MYDEAQQRRAGQLATDYLLRATESLNLALDGDLTKGLVFLAVVQANAQPADPPRRKDEADATALTCDDRRRPISGGGLAASLNIPAETVRRKVKALIAAGYLRRMNGGLVAPTEALERPEVVRMIRANYLSLCRLFSQLRGLGIDLNAEPDES
jgi:hypothetical protein